jgi:hypothetical protein
MGPPPLASADPPHSLPLLLTMLPPSMGHVNGVDADADALEFGTLFG